MQISLSSKASYETIKEIARTKYGLVTLKQSTDSNNPELIVEKYKLRSSYHDRYKQGEYAAEREDWAFKQMLERAGPSEHIVKYLGMKAVQPKNDEKRGSKITSIEPYDNFSNSKYEHDNKEAKVVVRTEYVDGKTFREVVFSMLEDINKNKLDVKTYCIAMDQVKIDCMTIFLHIKKASMLQADLHEDQLVFDKNTGYCVMLDGDNMTDFTKSRYHPVCGKIEYAIDSGDGSKECPDLSDERWTIKQLATIMLKADKCIPSKKIDKSKEYLGHSAMLGKMMQKNKKDRPMAENILDELKKTMTPERRQTARETLMYYSGNTNFSPKKSLVEKAKKLFS